MSEINNRQVIDKAFKGYQQHIDKVVYDRLDKWCATIIREAVANRMLENSDIGHNFTGNLINSICVLLYRKSNHSKTSYFASQTGIKPAVCREISGLNTRGKKRVYRVRFGPGNKAHPYYDWMGEASVLKADSLIPTDQSYGATDARQFADRWSPQNIGMDFVICVAYTSEYASFVEHQRQTTGILETEFFVQRTAVEWVGLKAA